MVVNGGGADVQIPRSPQVADIFTQRRSCVWCEKGHQEKMAQMYAQNRGRPSLLQGLDALADETITKVKLGSNVQIIRAQPERKSLVSANGCPDGARL